MPQFRYVAVEASSEPLEGRMEAPSKSAVIERLHAAGHVPIRVHEVSVGSLAAVDLGDLFRRRVLPQRSLALITGQLATLLQAGLALDEVADRLGLHALANGAALQLWDAVGCADCAGTGYRGQMAVLEVLAMSDAIRRLVLNHAEAREIHGVAVEEGMRTMYQDGLLKALDGDTTIEEVLRVTRDV